MLFDPDKFGAAMGEAIRKAVEPLQNEIASLKSQLAQKPDFSQAIAEEVAKAVSALPKPEPGKSITLEDVMPVLDEAMKGIRSESNLAVERILNDGRADREALQKAIKEIRQPEDGKSVTVAELEPIIQSEVAKAVGALPAPKDGAGVAGAMIDRDGELLLTMSNGEVKKLGKIVGKDGADFTEASFDYDGERTLTIKGKGGEITKHLPIPMDRGYYRDGMPTCEKGDIVTHDGNAWIALKETKARPGTDAKEDWRLFARKGRDGENTIKTVNGSPPAPIKLKD